ncbi:unnamed protein product [Sphagnum tenellum]
MALYHGGENDVEFVSTCPTSRDPSPTLEDADLEGVLMGYPNIFPISFTNLVAFKRICLARFNKTGVGTEFHSMLETKFRLLHVRSSLSGTRSGRFGYRGGVDYAGPPLEIPAEKLFDDLPQNLSKGEFLFTPDNLNEFNTSIWESYRLH